jgi:predicted enzyme related to lactoylglutathione lyase
MLSNNVPAWFEIPSANLDRAVKFYESVLGVKLVPDNFGPMRMAIFPHERKDSTSTGCLIAGDGYAPSAQGSIVYLNLSDDLAKPLARVEKAGGKVVLPKTALPDNIGFFAQFLDSEGNTVGFFSQH